MLVGPPDKRRWRGGEPALRERSIFRIKERRKEERARGNYLQQIPGPCQPFGVIRRQTPSLVRSGLLRPEPGPHQCELPGKGGTRLRPDYSRARAASPGAGRTAIPLPKRAPALC